MDGTFDEPEEWPRCLASKIYFLDPKQENGQFNGVKPEPYLSYDVNDFTAKCIFPNVTFYCKPEISAEGTIFNIFSNNMVLDCDSKPKMLYCGRELISKSVNRS